MTKSLIAEALGTFALVFVGTGAIVINDVSGGVVSHFGVSLSFGLIVMIVICTIGRVSGAHINPAVTLGFYLARRLDRSLVVPYILAQCAGAVAASSLIGLLFSGHATLGATLPAGTVVQAFVIEIALTWILVFVILNVSWKPNVSQVGVAGVIGATVGLAALFAGPMTGASMNPARTLGPALLSGEMGVLWLYFLAPAIGAVIAVPGCRLVQAPGCCSQAGRDATT